MNNEEPEPTASAGNPFADFGMSNPDERLAKATLALKITAIMREQGLTQAEMADRLGIDQPQVSRLSRGALKDFSIGRLMDLVKRLNQDIDIIVRDNPEPSRRARVAVTVTSTDDAIAADGQGRSLRMQFD